MDILQFEAETILMHLKNMYLEKAKQSQTRSGLHASSLLVPQSEWCTRRHVLLNTCLEKAEQLPVQHWDWKREAVFDDGWKRHERFQKLFQDYGNPVWNEELQGYELDLTHYDQERELYFSPDAILHIGPHKYLFEIKGLKSEAFALLTPDLMQAMSVSTVVASARIQANNYLHFSGMEDVEKAVLLIDNKNNQDFKVYVIERDPDLFKLYHERIRDVKSGTSNARRLHGLRILPRRVCSSPDSPLAKKCVMCKQCFTEKG